MSLEKIKHDEFPSAETILKVCVPSSLLTGKPQSWPGLEEEPLGAIHSSLISQIVSQEMVSDALK